MTTRPKPFVFILMPFDPTFDDAYKLAIKPACEAAGAYAERVDEQVFHDSILQRIYNQIAKADYIVADMTGRNANVFYETGYAHALGKTVVLLTQKAADIPFDLQHYPHIVYGGKLVDLRRELEKRLTHLLEHATLSLPPPSTIEVSINGTKVGTANPQITLETSDGKSFEFHVSVFNSPSRFVRLLMCQVGLVTPASFAYSLAGKGAITSSFKIDEITTAHLLERDLRILPGAWHNVTFETSSEKAFKRGVAVGDFSIRIFTETGFVDFPFQVIPEQAI